MSCVQEWYVTCFGEYSNVSNWAYTHDIVTYVICPTNVVSCIYCNITVLVGMFISPLP